MEFFSSAEARAVRPLPTMIPRCDQCGLYRACGSPKMEPSGRGGKRVLLVGEYPGADEDAKGDPLVGQTGRFLADVLDKLGIDMRRDCWLTNALICHDAEKRHPKTAVTDCRPNLLKTIERLKPAVIVLMGGAAIASLLGHLWKADTGKVKRWPGWVIPARRPNAWVVPTYNPAFLLRRKDDRVLSDDFRDHLRDAFKLEGRPWQEVPDEGREVEVILSPAEAARRLDAVTDGEAAFDFETTTLKPDGPHAAIVCASVCTNGRETFAFPWGGPVVPAFRRFLQDRNIAKIGWNLKFEDRWCMRKVGTPVSGWAWDGMLAAHALDPRRGVTGLKFQAFVNLGMPDYNSHVEPFLDGGKESGCNAPNRIRQVGLPTLCRYCAVDSLLEYKVAKIQMKEMGYDV